MLLRTSFPTTNLLFSLFLGSLHHKHVTFVGEHEWAATLCLNSLFDFRLQCSKARSCWGKLQLKGKQHAHQLCVSENSNFKFKSPVYRQTFANSSSGKCMNWYSFVQVCPAFFLLFSQAWVATLTFGSSTDLMCIPLSCLNTQWKETGPTSFTKNKSRGSLMLQ